MKPILVALWLCIALSGVYAQSTTSPGDAKFRVDAQKPTVYLRVEHADQKLVRLRLCNNSKWSIVVTTFAYYRNNRRINLTNGRAVITLPDDKEIQSLYYYLEQNIDGKTNTIFGQYSDMSFVSFIESGKSILFSVSTKAFKPGSTLYVPFHYEWEAGERMTITGEPEHRAFLKASNLK